MNTFEYYQTQSFQFPEIAIALEDSKDNVCKFFIPTLTPTLRRDIIYDDEDLSVSTNNIINGNTTNIRPCITSNYIELPLPFGIDSCNKDDEFIVTFIGGDINKPYLLGRYTK